MHLKSAFSSTTTVQRDMVVCLELALANIKEYDNTCMWEVMRMSGIFFAESWWNILEEVKSR